MCIKQEREATLIGLLALAVRFALGDKSCEAGQKTKVDARYSTSVGLGTDLGLGLLARLGVSPFCCFPWSVTMKS